MEIPHYPWKSKAVWGAGICIIAALYEVFTGDLKTAIELFGIGLGILGIRAKLEEWE